MRCVFPCTTQILLLTNGVQTGCSWMLFAHNNSRFELIHLPLHAFNEPLPPLSVWRQATRANVEPLSTTLCCQQNPTRDTGGRGPSSSICIVGELSGLSILHLVDACACLLSKYLPFTCIIQALFWVFVVFFVLQTVEGLLETEAGGGGGGGGVFVHEWRGQSCWAHSQKHPQGPTLGPSRGQITGS